MHRNESSKANKQVADKLITEIGTRPGRGDVNRPTGVTSSLVRSDWSTES